MKAQVMQAPLYEIRPLKAEDREIWLVLFKAYTDFYKRDVSSEVTEETFDRLLSGQDTMHAIIAADPQNGQPLGFAHVVRHRSTWSPTWYCYLEDLYVEEAARGRGIGRALIAAVYNHADEYGCTRTYWITQTENATARALYDRMAGLADFVQYRR